MSVLPSLKLSDKVYENKRPDLPKLYTIHYFSVSYLTFLDIFRQWYNINISV